MQRLTVYYKIGIRKFSLEYFLYVYLITDEAVILGIIRFLVQI